MRLGSRLRGTTPVDGLSPGSFRQAPRTLVASWLWLQLTFSTKRVSCPTQIVLPRVKKITRCFKKTSMLGPNLLGQIHVVRFSAEIIQRINQPVL